MMAKVFSITVGRVYNLGNYENMRYELTIELREGEHPGPVIAHLELVFKALNPKSPVSSYSLEQAFKLLGIPERERTAMQRRELEGLQGQLDLHRQWEEDRKLALSTLHNLGGSEAYKNAKESWASDKELDIPDPND